MNRKTLYFEHYFHGEHDLNALLRIKYFGKDWDTMPNISVVIDSTTLESLNTLGIIDNKALIDSLKVNWDVSVEGANEEYNIQTNILELSYPENLDKDELMNHLYDIAIEQMDSASGDDDFFDYTPGLVSAIQEILFKLGFKEAFEGLEDELEKRGHYD